MTLSFFEVDNRCILFEPLLHVVHVVFRGNDRRAVVDFREACGFVAVDPLLEGGDAPRPWVVEDHVEPPDALAEGYDKRFIGGYDLLGNVPVVPDFPYRSSYHAAREYTLASSADDFLVYFIRFHIVVFFAGGFCRPEIFNQISSTFTLLTFAQNTPLQ